MAPTTPRTVLSTLAGCQTVKAGVGHEEMISKDSGSVSFPGWQQALTPTMTRESFLTSELGRCSLLDVESEPYCSWKIVPATTPSATWHVCVGFHSDKMEVIHIQADRPEFGSKWSEFSPEKEEKRRALHDSILRADLGPPSYHFPWGTVTSTVDMHCGVSLIVVRYSTHGDIRLPSNIRKWSHETGDFE